MKAAVQGTPMSLNIILKQDIKSGSDVWITEYIEGINCVGGCDFHMYHMENRSYIEDEHFPTVFNFIDPSEKVH